MMQARAHKCFGEQLHVGWLHVGWLHTYKNEERRSRAVAVVRQFKYQLCPSGTEGPGSFLPCVETVMTRYVVMRYGMRDNADEPMIMLEVYNRLVHAWLVTRTMLVWAVVQFIRARQR